MSIHLDTHLHTRRHSVCSIIDEHQLIHQAVKKGLDGLVITEHHYQWSDEELGELLEKADAPGFIVLAGFEYTSSQGDILVYGLESERSPPFKPGMDPAKALDLFHELGAVCVAAHPTRAHMSFDMSIQDMPFDGLEVASSNLQIHEQRMARHLAEQLGIPQTASSDAHCLPDVGAYALQFEDPVVSMAHFVQAMRQGRFKPVSNNR